MKLDKDTVRAASRLQDVIPVLLGASLNDGKGGEPAIPCFMHKDGGRPNLRVNLVTQQWYCDVCQVGGDVFKLVEMARRVDFPTALRWLAERTHVEPERRIVKTYDYQDERGALAYQVVRYEPKDFRQRRPDGNGGWIWKMAGVPLLVYRRPELRGREAVAIVGGEKDVDALWAINIPATTNSGGETKWTGEHTAQLVSAGVKRVLVIPDNDDKGRQHARIVADSCIAAGLSAKVLTLPGIPPKGDVSDYLASHGRTELVALMKSAPAYQPAPAASERQGGPVLVCMSDVQPEEVAWVWPERIARGKLTILQGDPGVGKSTVSLDIIARISRGAEWPDGGRAPAGSAILLACEDGLADTIRPRLDRQGAAVGDVFALQATRLHDGTERHFSLDTDLVQLAAAIERHKPIILVIDPVSAYFGTGRDSYKDTEVRAVLSPLVSLAERTGTAILGLMHMTKAGQQKALYRALGSIAFAGTARVVLGAGKDPNADRCFLMAVKQNICPPSATLAYAIGSDQRLAWEADPVVGVNADAVLGSNAQAPDEDRDDAAEFLRELLADGAMPQTEVAKAGTGQGWSMSQLRRAMKRAGVKPEKSGFRGGWHWQLEPSAAPKMTDDDQNQPKVTRTRAGVIFGENSPVSPLDSTVIPKMTGVSSSVSSSEGSSPSGDGWGEV